jgi:hypothetical protein
VATFAGFGGSFVGFAGNLGPVYALYGKILG